MSTYTEIRRLLIALLALPMLPGCQSIPTQDSSTTAAEILNDPPGEIVYGSMGDLTGEEGITLWSTNPKDKTLLNGSRKEPFAEPNPNFKDT